LHFLTASGFRGRVSVGRLAEVNTKRGEGSDVAGAGLADDQERHHE
jgi:hypothetical protein